MRLRTFSATSWVFAFVLFMGQSSLAADPNKTLRVAFNAAETGFDPQAINDNYSYMVGDAIFDALYTYDYFARRRGSFRITAQGMPGDRRRRTHVHGRVKPGIYFADDPAFKGKRRELTAGGLRVQHQAQLRSSRCSPSLFISSTSSRTGRNCCQGAETNEFDYDAPIEGLQVLDRYTLRFKFRNPNYLFQHWLTSVALAAVAREVILAHQDASRRAMEHPVGRCHRLESGFEARRSSSMRTRAIA
jgi:ABC-type transport system substrate-binding protein